MAVNLSAYFPRIIGEWPPGPPRVRSRVVEGSLVFMDISGFTAMSERLATKGKIGAEEVTEVMDACFTSLLEAAYEEGGSLLKFGGDAMLLLFSGEQHPLRACRAAGRMRDRLRHEGRFRTSAGGVRLQMSVGVHSGDVHMFLVGSSHLELIVGGPAVSTTVELEAAANAGEIRVSEATASAIPPGCLNRSHDGSLFLASIPAAATGAGHQAPSQADVPNAERYVSVSIRDHLLETVTAESEHRRAVIGFIHFEGLDAVIAGGNIGRAEDALERLVVAVQDAAREYGLCFLSTDIDRDGGKIIVTTGVPKSTGRDEDAMLRAVTQVLSADCGLELRIGVNAGPVFAGDVGPPYRRTYTIMGDAVNLAARLMARAGAGQAITVPGVLRAARTEFETEALEPFHVKGKKEAITGYALGRLRGASGRVEAGHIPLVGREQEMHLLRGTLAGVREGQRAIVELVGDPGMGKSRLVQELKAEAQDLPCHEVTCDQYEGQTAYAPIRRLLLSIMGEEPSPDPARLPEALTDWVEQSAPDMLEWLPLIATPLDVSVPMTDAVAGIAARFRRGRLHRVLSDLLQRVLATPTLLVFEDVHWMDDASRDLLGDVLADATARPWLFLGTRRPGDPSPFAENDDTSVVVALEPLGADASHDLAVAALGGGAIPRHKLVSLAERGGGNPLFLREMALAVGGTAEMDELPESVEGLLTAQIDRLAGTERRVLRYAAVVGNTFSPALLQESLSDLISGSVAEACSRLSDFLEPSARGTYRFRHSLVRETAYSGLPFRLRMQLHERIGRNIERRLGRRAEARAELLSLHFHRARDFARSLRYSRIAANRAKDKSANMEAAEFYRRAIESAQHETDVPEAEIAELYEALGDVYELAAVYDEAARALSGARSHSRSGGDTCRLLRKEGVIRERLGLYSQALRWYGRGLKQVCSVPQDALQLQLAYAGVRFRQGRYADSSRWCLKVIPAAKAADDLPSLAHAYYLLDHAYTMLGSSEAGTYRQMALPIYEQLGDLVGQANVLNNLGVSATIDGDWDEALRLFERSRIARERVGDVVGSATATNNIGEVLLDRGRVDEAERLFREALRTWRGASYAVGIAVATSALGLAAVRSGRYGEARSLLDEALERFRTMGAASFVIETEARLAELFLASGDIPRARDAVDQALARIQSEDVGALAASLHRLRGITLLLAADLPGARAAIDQSVVMARALNADFERALSLRALALVERLEGRNATELRHESDTLLARFGVSSVPSLAAIEAQIEAMPADQGH